MTCVDRIKSICKERKIPISRLEKDLHFANGYIGKIKKGVLPADRLAKVSEYLSVSTDYLLGTEKEKPADKSGWPAKYELLSDQDRALVDEMIVRQGTSIDVVRVCAHWCNIRCNSHSALILRITPL